MTNPWAVNRAVHVAVSVAVCAGVNGSVFRAVNRAVNDAVWVGVGRDPDHPAIEDFLREVHRAAE